MQLYDMHSHILPEFDDGAKSIDESLTLLNCLKNQNVTNICLTPHFYTNEMSVSDFVKSRQEAYEKFLPHKPEGINLVLGTEVYVTKYLFTNDDLSGITYGKSKYILTEYAYSSSFADHTLEKFYKLMDNYSLIPVLTHVERYENLIHEPEIIRELKDMGVIIQTNISNYADKAAFFRKRKLLKFINEGLIDIIGSDTHSMTHNTPEVFTQALKCISNKCGEQKVEQMMNTAANIFNSAVGNM